MALGLPNQRSVAQRAISGPVTNFSTNLNFQRFYVVPSSVEMAFRPGCIYQRFFHCARTRVRTKQTYRPVLTVGVVGFFQWLLYEDQSFFLLLLSEV